MITYINVTNDKDQVWMCSMEISCNVISTCMEISCNGNWFAVESKSFEFTMEGEGKKAKCFITERSRGIASWIRFGVEGMNKLLEGIEECCRVSVPARNPWSGGRTEDISDWRERKTMPGGSFSVLLLMPKEKSIGWSFRKVGDF